MGYGDGDRRKFPRADYSCKVNIFYSEKAVNAVIRNIGAGGILAEFELETMRGIPVKMEMYVEGRTIVCNGHIVWLAPRSDSSDRSRIVWDTGIQFDDIEAEDRVFIRNLVDRLNVESK